MTSRKARTPQGTPTSETAAVPEGDGGGEKVTIASFEEAMRRLSRIVEDLEGGELSLEESLARFEEGVQLARASQARLDSAESRVEELMRVDEHGTPIVRNLDTE